MNYQQVRCPNGCDYVRVGDIDAEQFRCMYCKSVWTPDTTNHQHEQAVRNIIDDILGGAR